MRDRKSILKMAISKRKNCKNLTDIRTVCFLMRDDKYKKFPNRKRVLSKIFDSELSWQKRKEWIDSIIEWSGPRGENFEWQCILHNSIEVAQKLKNEKSKRIAGENNPAYNHSGLLSPFSDKFIGKATKADAIAKMKKTMASNKQNLNTCIEYYLNAGMTYEDAKIALKKRQTTVSLEKFIELYGKEEGERRHKERISRWQKTLNDKTPEELARINSLKCYKGSSVSRAEKELYNTLKKYFHELDSSFTILYNMNKNYYVYDIVLGNKIIEYNGDYWHANPDIYDETFLNKVSGMSSKQIWEKESHKEMIANKNGYEVMRVWENDYKIDKTKVVKECINFLNK